MDWINFLDLVVENRSIKLSFLFYYAFRDLQQRIKCSSITSKLCLQIFQLTWKNYMMKYPDHKTVSKKILGCLSSFLKSSENQTFELTDITSWILNAFVSNEDLLKEFTFHPDQNICASFLPEKYQEYLDIKFLMLSYLLKNNVLQESQILGKLDSLDLTKSHLDNVPFPNLESCKNIFNQKTDEFLHNLDKNILINEFKENNLEANWLNSYGNTADLQVYERPRLWKPKQISRDLVITGNLNTPLDSINQSLIPQSNRLLKRKFSALHPKP